MRYRQKIRFILLIALYLGSICAACRAEEIRDPALDRLLEKVKTDYGIIVHYAEGPAQRFPDFNFSLTNAGDIQVSKKVILIFVKEISLYPKDFFRDANCQDIYFVQKLFYKQKPVDGVFAQGTNYIFYDYARDDDNTQKIRHNIHHELYHMIGSKHPFWEKHRSIWEALNRADFSYNQKCNLHERNPFNFSAPSEPGFITDYAMTSGEEDRAEVFACMMIPEQLSLMEQWAQNDKILFKKVEIMKKFLEEAFQQK